MMTTVCKLIILLRTRCVWVARYSRCAGETTTAPWHNLYVSFPNGQYSHLSKGHRPTLVRILAIALYGQRQSARTRFRYVDTTAARGFKRRVPALKSQNYWFFVRLKARRGVVCKNSTPCRSCSATWTRCATTRVETITVIGWALPNRCP